MTVLDAPGMFASRIQGRQTVKNSRIEDNGDDFVAESNIQGQCPWTHVDSCDK